MEAKKDAAVTPEPTMLVVDISLEASAEAMGTILNEHCERGFYVNAVAEWPGTGARVILRRYSTGNKLAPKEGATPTAADKEAEEVDAIIRRNPKCPAGKLADKLAEHGIVRHPVWVASRRKILDRMATAEKARRDA